MQTDDLIRMMGADAPVPLRVRHRRVLGAIAALFAAFAVIVMATLGVRPDLGEMAARPAMLFKYVFLFAAVLASGFAWWGDGQPVPPRRAARYALYGLGVALVALAVFSGSRLTGDAVRRILFIRPAYFCVGYITVFTVAGAYALSRIGDFMAPAQIRRHAALTTMFASSLGGLAFALHCPNDHPVYLAVWYMVTALACMAALGPRIARRQAW